MLTADSLIQQYESSWSALSPRQQAALRGNLTWLMARTSDPHDLARLEAVRRAIAPTQAHRRNAQLKPTATAVPKADTSADIASTSAATFFSSRLQLVRTPLAASECPALGAEIHTIGDARRIAHALIGAEAQEHFLLLLLNSQLEVTGVHIVHIGTTSQCVIHAGDVLRVPLLGNAQNVIVAHNHPSGHPEPSEADIRTTRSLVAAAQLLDLRLVDHLIVTDDPTRYTSLANSQPSLFSKLYTWS